MVRRLFIHATIRRFYYYYRHFFMVRRLFIHATMVWGQPGGFEPINSPSSGMSVCRGYPSARFSLKPRIIIFWIFFLNKTKNVPKMGKMAKNTGLSGFLPNYVQHFPNIVLYSSFSIPLSWKSSACPWKIHFLASKGVPNYIFFGQNMNFEFFSKKMFGSWETPQNGFLVEKFRQKY